MTTNESPDAKPPSNRRIAETLSVLREITADAADLKRAVGGSITDVVADWLAPQYLLAAREKLSGTEGARHWEILRAFVQDWAMLRHGDHTAVHAGHRKLNPSRDVVGAAVARAARQH